MKEIQDESKETLQCKQESRDYTGAFGESDPDQ
jgi:hypothetical protein